MELDAELAYRHILNWDEGKDTPISQSYAVVHQSFYPQDAEDLMSLSLPDNHTVTKKYLFIGQILPWDFGVPENRDSMFYTSPVDRMVLAT